MNISLTPELAKFVEKEVESGLYQTASEVVRAGPAALRKTKPPADLNCPEPLKNWRHNCCKALTAWIAAKALTARKCFAGSANG